MELGVSTFICNRKRLLDVLPVFADGGIGSLELWGAFRFGSEHHFPYWESGYADRLVGVLKKLCIKTRTLHAPFSETLDISSPDDSLRREALQEIENAVSVFSGLPGAEIVVVHPGGLLADAGEEKERLLQSRKSLVGLDAFIGRHGLRLAVENMLPGLVAWRPSELVSLIEGLPHAGICLDTGHAHISGVLEEFLKESPGRIITLHLSDTYDSTDRHLLPFEGGVDWENFRRAMIGLAEGKYAPGAKGPGTLTFETRHRGDLPASLVEIKEVFRRLKL